MKLLKKLLTGVGAAGVLLASNCALAIPGDTKLLQFSDGGNNQLYTVATTNTLVQVFAITINRWRMNFTIGFTGSDTNSLTMTMNGNGIFWNPANVNTATNGATAYCKLGTEAQCFGGIDGLTGPAAFEQTLKVRLVDRTFAVPTGSAMSLRDDFSVSSQPGAFGGTAFVQISTPNSTPTSSALFPTNLATVNTINYNYTTNSAPMQVIAGFDLVASAPMNNNGITDACLSGPQRCNRFDLSNTISIAFAVPEPDTLGLFGLSLLGLGMVGRRRAARKSAAV